MQKAFLNLLFGRTSPKDGAGTLPIQANRASQAEKAFTWSRDHSTACLGAALSSSGAFAAMQCTVADQGKESPRARSEAWSALLLRSLSVQMGLNSANGTMTIGTLHRVDSVNDRHIHPSPRFGPMSSLSGFDTRNVAANAGQYYACRSSRDKLSLTTFTRHLQSGSRLAGLHKAWCHEVVDTKLTVHGNRRSRFVSLVTSRLALHFAAENWVLTWQRRVLNLATCAANTSNGVVENTLCIHRFQLRRATVHTCSGKWSKPRPAHCLFQSSLSREGEKSSAHEQISQTLETLSMLLASSHR
nr:hypothetical protein CFP56_67737 [Quercus suber]